MKCGPQALLFIPLAAASLFLKLCSVWARMTTEREWRRWLSYHLFDCWLQCGQGHERLRHMRGDLQTPEYRIAEDARVATDLPIDLLLGLLASVLSAIAFIRVL
jgi:putative ATP-binding cassette transporter